MVWNRGGPLCRGDNEGLPVVSLFDPQPLSIRSEGVSKSERPFSATLVHSCGNWVSSRDQWVSLPGLNCRKKRRRQKERGSWSDGGCEYHHDLQEAPGLPHTKHLCSGWERRKKSGGPQCILIQETIQKDSTMQERPLTINPLLSLQYLALNSHLTFQKKAESDTKAANEALSPISLLLLSSWAEAAVQLPQTCSLYGNTGAQRPLTVWQFSQRLGHLLLP